MRRLVSHRAGILRPGMGGWPYRRGDPGFEVLLGCGKGESGHHVTMAEGTCKRPTGGDHAPERCVEETSRFLLDRKPKEFDPRPTRR